MSTSEGLSPPDLARRGELRRMKALAGALLVVAAVVYVVARRAEADGAATWWGFVRAAAEAGMVGGLADWFAVTALFRRPLGLPVPHTAIIPTRKDALGRGLGDFVGAHFLTERVVRDRLARARVARRVGAWLADPAHAERVAGEVAAAVRGALGVLRDDDVQDLLEHSVLPRVLDVPAGPPAGRLLHDLVGAGAHQGVLTLVAEHAHGWLGEHRDLVVAVVARQAPGWSPTFVDARVAARVHAELTRVAGEVAADGDHPVRRSVDRLLFRLAEDLQHDPATLAWADAAVRRLVERPAVRRMVGDAVATARRLLLELVEDPSSDLRLRLRAALVDLGARLRADEPLGVKVDAWVAGAASHVVSTYRDDLTSAITETVDRWDGVETARRVELAVGRDLQFIRINGTVVGALVGVCLHTAGLLLG